MILREIPGKQVIRRTRRFSWYLLQGHAGLFESPAAFAMVACRTGSDKVGPGVLSAKVLGEDMIDGQGLMAIATILAFPIITPENFQS